MKDFRTRKIPFLEGLLEGSSVMFKDMFFMPTLYRRSKDDELLQEIEKTKKRLSGNPKSYKSYLQGMLIGGHIGGFIDFGYLVAGFYMSITNDDHRLFEILGIMNAASLIYEAGRRAIKN